MDYDLISLVPSSLSADASNAVYSCTLTNLWTEATHPVLYDGIRSSAHWSPPVLASHAENFPLWVPNTAASPSIEMIAEMGVTSPLRQEIEGAQDLRLAGDFTIGTDQFNALDEPQTFSDIELTPEFPFVSSISMVAPSPDWFSGISSFRPVDAIDGVWYEFFEVATYPWDAGTEMGDTYSLSNDAQVPPNPITRLTVDTVPETGVFLSPSGSTVPPVALWSCILRQDDSQTVSADPINPSDQEQEIAVTVEEDLNDDNSTIIDDDDDEEEENLIISNDNIDESNDDKQPVVCLRYFRQCGEDSDCCSNNCSRGRCSERARASSRSDGLRLSNQGGATMGGAAGRTWRSSRTSERTSRNWRNSGNRGRMMMRDEGSDAEAKPEPQLRGSADWDANLMEFFAGM